MKDIRRQTVTLWQAAFWESAEKWKCQMWHLFSSRLSCWKRCEIPSQLLSWAKALTLMINAHSTGLLPSEESQARGAYAGGRIHKKGPGGELNTQLHTSTPWQIMCHDIKHKTKVSVECWKVVFIFSSFLLFERLFFPWYWKLSV